MHTQRPVFLNLMQIKFPVTAIVSIFHRVSGVLVFLYLPFILYALDQSLSGAQAFTHLRQCLAGPLCQVMVWLGLSAYFYHLLAGVRHLLMDLGWGETLCCARASAYLLLTSAVIVSILMGVWIWS